MKNTFLILARLFVSRCSLSATTLCVAVLALLLNGCVTPLTEVQIADIEVRCQPELRKNAEQIPQNLAPEAAAAFSKGKFYYIWLDKGDPIHVTPGEERVRLHYAINPDKQSLPRPEVASITSIPGGSPKKSLSRGWQVFLNETLISVDDGSAALLESTDYSRLPPVRLRDGNLLTYFRHYSYNLGIKELEDNFRPYGSLLELIEADSLSNILTNRIILEPVKH